MKKTRMILFTLLIDVMIKWKKWILELLPTGKRTLMMYALCVVLTFPIVKLYGEFTTWRTRMRIKSGATPQTCMLRKIIKDELGVDVLIEESDGKPTDFVIKTSFVNVDVERRLFALLDRYKLAGKSYGYENAKILYDSRWTAYLCEKIMPIVVTVTFYRDDFYITRFTIQSDLPVTSDLNINIMFYFIIEEQESLAPFDFLLKAGESYYELSTWDFSGYKGVTMSPEGDDYYDYVLKIETVYEKE